MQTVADAAGPAATAAAPSRVRGSSVLKELQTSSARACQRSTNSLFKTLVSKRSSLIGKFSKRCIGPRSVVYFAHFIPPEMD